MATPSPSIVDDRITPLEERSARSVARGARSNSAMLRRPILAPGKCRTNETVLLTDRLSDLLNGRSLERTAAQRLALETEAVMAERGMSVVDEATLFELAEGLRGVRALTEVGTVVDSLPRELVGLASPSDTDPFAPVTLPLFGIYEAAGAHDPDVEIVFRGLTRAAISQTADVVQRELSNVLEELADAFGLSPLQRQQVGRRMRADLAAGEFDDGDATQLGGALDRFSRRRGDTNEDLADELNDALYRGFLVESGTAFGDGEERGFTTAPGYTGLKGTVAAESEQVLVKVGCLELTKNLTSGTDRQPPVHLIEQQGVFSDDLTGIGNTYQDIPTVELFAEDVRRRSDVDTLYPDPHLNDPTPSKYFVKVAPTVSVATYSLRLKSNSSVSRRTLPEVREALTKGAPRLAEKRSELSKKAKESARQAVRSAARSAGAGSLERLTDPLVDALIGAFIDYAIDTAGGLVHPQFNYPKLVLFHATVFPRKSDEPGPLSIVSVVKLTPVRPKSNQGMARDPGERKGELVPFTRIKGPMQEPEFDAEVDYKQERFFRWWVGASAPPAPFGRDYDSLTEPFEQDYNQLKLFRKFEENFRAAPQAIVWRDPLAVPDGALGAVLEKNGVVLAKRASGERYAYRGFGGIIRLDIGVQSSVWVAVRAETYLVPADADFLHELTGPGFPE